MAGKTVAAKLGVKPGMACRIAFAPDGLDPAAAGWPADTASDPPQAGADHLLVFVASVAELAERAPAALAACRTGRHLWFAYPKKTGRIRTDITRDIGWEPLVAAGLLPVTQIAIDDTWSALRFRRREEIPTLTRKSEIPGAR